MLYLIKKPYSASTMFVAHGIPSFYELLLTSIHRFADRVSKNSNSIIITCMTPIVYMCRDVTKGTLRMNTKN